MAGESRQQIDGKDKIKRFLPGGKGARLSICNAVFQVWVPKGVVERRTAEGSDARHGGHFCFVL